MARSKEVDATELPPLHETLDPDALDTLCSSHTDGGGDDGTAVLVQFTYAGRDVVVRAPERIEVRHPDSGRDRTSTK